MFCNQCGEEVPEDSKFCPFCGASNHQKAQESAHFRTNRKKRVF